MDGQTHFDKTYGPVAPGTFSAVWTALSAAIAAAAASSSLAPLALAFPAAAAAAAIDLAVGM